MTRPNAENVATTWIKRKSAQHNSKMDQIPSGNKRKKNKMKDIKKKYIEHAMNRPGSSAAYWPIELLKMQCTLTSSTALTIAHAVNVEIRLKIVNRAETMINNPAQKPTVKWFPARKLVRTSVVTFAELKSMASSVDSKRDMNTMLLA